VRNSTSILAALAALAFLVANPWTPDVLADRKDNKKALKQTMKRWGKELGVKCGHCHVKQGRKFDYEAPTHNKAVSLVCADEFVEKLRLDQDRRLSCATCHVDKAHTFLPRPADGEARDEAQVQADVSAYCEETFVGKLKTAEGQAVSCATCHGDAGQPANFFHNEGDPLPEPEPSAE
jgi:mono/diheme cytochrome c family protein